MEELSAVKDLEKVTELFSAVMKKVITERTLDKYKNEQITPTQLDTLKFLLHYELPTISNIAEGLDISLPSTTKAVDRLADKGLVTREKEPEDRRTVRVRLTGKGQFVATLINSKEKDTLSEIMKGMTTDEQDHLVHGLESFVKAAICDEYCVEEVCLRCGPDHDNNCVVYEKLTRLRN